jgi:tRNA A37 threonylcarbamoyladenosine modification protein TsaB
MYLLFNLSGRDTIKLVLFNKRKIISNEFTGQNRELLVCLDKILISNKINKDDIEGIMVVVGEGGFTSTRIATTVANIFAYVRQIPLLTISSKQADNPQKLIDKLLKQSKGHYISATYSAEANITKAKRFKI